jgi:hypothetical protein
VESWVFRRWLALSSRTHGAVGAGPAASHGELKIAGRGAPVTHECVTRLKFAARRLMGSSVSGG